MSTNVKLCLWYNFCGNTPKVTNSYWKWIFFCDDCSFFCTVSFQTTMKIRFCHGFPRWTPVRSFFNGQGHAGRALSSSHYKAVYGFFLFYFALQWGFFHEFLDTIVLDMERKHNWASQIFSEGTCLNGLSEMECFLVVRQNSKTKVFYHLIPSII